MDRNCFVCNSRFPRNSSGRPLECPAQRLFFSIRTMKTIPHNARICFNCRNVYREWKSKNEAFRLIMEHFEEKSGSRERTLSHNSESMDSIIEISTTSSSTSSCHANKPSVEEPAVEIRFDRVAASHHQCCICRAVDPNSTSVISDEDRDLIFMRQHIFVPKGARCCAKHLENKRLSYESFKNLIIYDNELISFTSDEIKSLLLKYQSALESEKQIHFEQSSSLTDTDYYNLIGLTKPQFDKLISFISDSNIIHQSANRSVRTAIGLLLCKLRLDSARKALMANFVPKNVGFHHIDRDTIIKNHTTTIAKELIGGGRDVAIVVADGTYLYVQKSRNNIFQRRSFSIHKHRSLLKPMTIVSTTGYIISVLGPFLSDSTNNDANILKHVFFNNMEDVLNWFEEEDKLVVDRGFRDCLNMMNRLGIEVAMPSFLNGKKQFDVGDANRSRLVTKVRWIVESVNGRLKQFKFFNQTIQNKALIKSKPEDRELAASMLALVNKRNEVQDMILEKNLLSKTVWKKIDSSNYLNFPMLSEEELREITFGVFQIKRARSYAEEHILTTDLSSTVINYELQTCTKIPNLIKVRMQSVHSRRKSYESTIHHSKDEIKGWYCTCPDGAKVVGCCSHIASVIWYLAYERFQSEERPKPSGTYISLVDDSIVLSDFYDSSEADDSDDDTNDNEH
ncbi:unnamed protein product [Rotaria sordida]|uniref:SWIM-type domain-containing protein n=1 Tax=Rotaria sordida TaxID=392033 RepID=A0A820ARU5_9BILA|nr:unnamed protein product [Rotaria sordida]